MNDLVSMVREDLYNIPAFTLPPGYSIRWYGQGDEKAWVEIQAASDRFNTITPELYRGQFGTDVPELHRRQCFILDHQGMAIGTATAWFDENYRGRPFGRVHWVAIIPSSQGRGLAKPLMTTVCERLASLGHSRAYLTTSTARIPALNLYLRFGFVPEIKSESDRQAWQAVQDRLSTLGDKPGAI